MADLSRRTFLQICAAIAATGCGEDLAHDTDPEQEAIPGPGPARAEDGGRGLMSPDAADGAVPPTVPDTTATLLPVPTATESSPVIRGFSVNAIHNPHGRPCVWRVEYGRTTAYGTTTPDRALPGKLAAYYREKWSKGLNGWRGSATATALVHHAEEGGFVRYTDDGHRGDDDNHIDGVGMVHLPLYLHTGHVNSKAARPRLGGNGPDLRGAQLSMRVRSKDWVPNGSRLHMWTQAYDDHYEASASSDIVNYAHTGVNFNAAVAAATVWTPLTWTLRNRTQDWTYAGRNRDQDGEIGARYFYGELDNHLRQCDVDFFPFMVVDVEGKLPSGSIDFDDFQVTYRNTNLCYSGNGGSLVSAPAGGTGSEYLTDGWRNVGAGGAGEWQSAVNPVGPQSFVYAFATPVSVYSVQIHNASANPSRNIAVDFSNNGVDWTELITATLPATHEEGDNFVFHHRDKYAGHDFGSLWVPVHHPYFATVTHIRVRVLDGYSTSRWGLGEIEVFGEGAVMETENADYDVSQDIEVAAGTWHYRVIFEDADGLVTTGSDQVVTVPEVAGVARPFVPYDVNHILGTGQSLAVGYGSTATSLTQPYKNLMLAFGVQAPRGFDQPFIPLVEAGRETMSSAMANHVSMRAIAAWRGAPHDMLVSVHGAGGTGYAGIKKGTEFYTRGMNQVSGARARALINGQSHVVRAVTSVHGETDSIESNPNYEAHMVQWQADYEADCRALTGQTEPVPMFHSQNSAQAGSAIPLQMLAAHVNNPGKIVLVCPKYHLTRFDSIHLDTAGYRHLGELYAKAYKRVCIDGLTWEPLRPRTVTRLGAIITIVFHVPALPLVFDTTRVAASFNMGFGFVNHAATLPGKPAAGSAPAIAKVAITDLDTVTITLAGVPTAAGRIRYGVDHVGPDGPRGNLRDSDATPSRFGYALHNWCVHFESAAI